MLISLSFQHQNLLGITQSELVEGLSHQKEGNEDHVTFLDDFFKWLKRLIKELENQCMLHTCTWRKIPRSVVVTLRNLLSMSEQIIIKDKKNEIECSCTKKMTRNEGISCQTTKFLTKIQNPLWVEIVLVDVPLGFKKPARLYRAFGCFSRVHVISLEP